MNTLRYPRHRLSLILLTGALFAGTASGNLAGQTASVPAAHLDPASGPGIAANAYVGTNVSGNGTGYVTNYAVSNAGVSLSATGSSVSGASGYLNVTAQFVFATDGKYLVTYTRDAAGGLRQTASIDGTAHNITPQDSEVGPLTLDRTGHTLYAAEINYDGTDDDAYTSWTINADGSLTYVAAVGSDVDYHSYLSFAPNNQFAYGYGCYFANWDVFGLMRNQDGSLSSFDSQAQIPPGNNDPMYCPADLAASAMSYLAVDYVDISTQGSNYLLATYAINSDGTLGLVPNSEIATPFTGERSLAFDPTGQYLAVAGDAGLQMYSLQSGGILSPVGSVVDAGVPFNVVKWDNSGHLYAVNGTGFYVFTSAAGVLTQDPGSPLPVSQGGSLAVLPRQ